jgi:hypothetical protein
VLISVSVFKEDLLIKDNQILTLKFENKIISFVSKYKPGLVTAKEHQRFLLVIEYSEKH